MIENVGFSGSRNGMTLDQHRQVQWWLHLLTLSPSALQAHHGMCLGADEEFHHLARSFEMHIVGHPGVTREGQPYYRSTVQCDEVMPEEPFLYRNQIIAAKSQVIMATPAQKVEQFRGSGTWYMIRYVTQLMHETGPQQLWVVFPDGTTQGGPPRG